MFSVSFKADNQTQVQQQKNSIGLTENGQKVFNQTNGYANIINVMSNEDERKQYIQDVKENPILVPAIISPTIGTIYTYNQYRKGNISKEDAFKITAYNALANAISS